MDFPTTATHYEFWIANSINAYTIIPVKTKQIWDEGKRKSNIAKHGLDFADAYLVFDSPYRLDITVVRNGEERTQSFSYVFDKLAVLLVIHIERGEKTRVISFRPASQIETEAYNEWLANDFQDS
jgi:uncharacterized DUF497 family protein